MSETETKKVRKGTMLANETHCIHIIKPIDGFVLTHNWKGLEYIKRIPNPNESVSRLQIDESTVRRLESNESTTTDSSFSVPELNFKAVRVFSVLTKKIKAHSNIEVSNNIFTCISQVCVENILI